MANEKHILPHINTNPETNEWTPIDAAAINDGTERVDVARIKNIDSQLAQTVQKNVANQVTLEMLDQTAKESMTGGSVAVVGNSSVGLGQLTTSIQKDISVLRVQSHVPIMDKHYRNVDGKAVEFSAANYHTIILPATSGDIYNLNTRTLSTNQTGVIFVDGDMNILSVQLKGTGKIESYVGYEVFAPTGTTNVIFSVYESPSVYFSVKKYVYSPIAKKEYVDELGIKINELEEQLPEKTRKQDLDILRNIHYRDVNGTATEFSFPDYHSAILSATKDDLFFVNTRAQSVNQIGIMFADAGNKILKKFLVGTGAPVIHSDYEVVAPQNTKKMIVSVFGEPATYLSVTKYASGVIATEKYVNDTVDQFKSYWYGKTIVFNGDSITDPNYNSSLSYRYPEIIRDQLGFSDFHNYGISGSTIAVNPDNPSNRNPFVTRIDEMIVGDLNYFAFGTNDWFYTWTPLGSMNSRDIHTFYGALHVACLALLKKCKNKTIVFATPIMRRQGFSVDPLSVNGNGKTLREYCDIIKEVCEDFYGIPVVDMYRESGMFPFDDEIANEYYTRQGSPGSYYWTHPKGEGQLMMGRRGSGFVRQLA